MFSLGGQVGPPSHIKHKKYPQKSADLMNPKNNNGSNQNCSTLFLFKILDLGPSSRDLLLGTNKFITNDVFHGTDPSIRDRVHRNEHFMEINPV